MKLVFILITVIVSTYIWRHFKKPGGSWNGVVVKVISKMDSWPEKADPSNIKIHHYITCDLDAGGRIIFKLNNMQMHNMFPSGVKKGDRISKISQEGEYRLET
ncbi:MAG: hypothetical protein GY729_20235 [Desulfobacteraceae bacterium]|nr:hypothetical protein [Desulfobacteraceae bacterium]